MTRPEVSVIIPAKNVAGVVAEQLQALVDQVDAPKFEVILADNGSTDGLAEIIRKFESSLDIRVVDASGSPGAAYARNRGASEAGGAVYLFCDADDIVCPEWIAEMSHAVLSGSRCMAAGRLRHDGLNDEDQIYAYEVDTAEDDLHYSRGGLRTASASFAGYLPSAPGASLGFRAEDYHGLGGMDPTYPGGSEEPDLLWRAMNGGYRLIFAPAAAVQYRLRDDPRGVFRQQRIQQMAKVLLWMRFRDQGMSGPSFKVSLMSVVTESAGLLLASERRDVLRHARCLGGHLGALQGMWRYRILRRVPDPRLGEGLEGPAELS